jgi:hypothetical protein
LSNFLLCFDPKKDIVREYIINYAKRHMLNTSAGKAAPWMFYVTYYVLPGDDPCRVETRRRKLEKICCYSALYIVFTSASASVCINFLSQIMHGRK